MDVAAKVGTKTIRLINKTIDTAILAIILLLVAADCYAVWDSQKTYEWAAASDYTAYKPQEGASLSFAELQEINPDVFGWIVVYGTHIDYPVVQGRDNNIYVNTSALGRYSLSGAIFLDARNSRDFSDYCSILYGHHMEKQAMFGEIGNFADAAYFNEHRYGMLYFEGRECGMEFFAFLHVDAYDTEVFRPRILGEDEQKAYLELLYEIAIHDRDIGVRPDDHLVLLSTCATSTTNGRDVLVGRITDEAFEDSFGSIAAETPSIDRFLGLWDGLPLWAKFAVIVLPLALVVLLVMRLARRKRKNRVVEADE